VYKIEKKNGKTLMKMDTGQKIPIAGLPGLCLISDIHGMSIIGNW
jgi:hypothetical protein